MAALSASQAPGFLPVAHASPHRPTAVTPPPGPAIDGGSPYITAMPPLNTPTGPVAPTAPGPTPGVPAVTVPAGGASLPATVLAAYLRAQRTLAARDPGCHLPWQLLAAIGQVESGQARGGAVDADGTTYTPILGPVLDGHGFANIGDTDGGAYDGDPAHDRAVGPMQFIPSTWRTWGADGNGDGVRDPDNVYDAALAAGGYLCADGRDLAVPHDLDRAILGYNHSQAYLDLVKAWYAHFRRGGAVSVADRGGSPAPGVTPAPAGLRPGAGPAATGGPGRAAAAHGPTPAPGTGRPSPNATPPSAGPSGTPSGAPTPGSSGTSSGAASGAPTTAPTSAPTGTSTASATPSSTPEPGATPTASPTPSGCATDSPSPTPSDTQSATPTPSDSPTGATTPAPAPCDPSPSPSTSSPSATSSPSVSPSPSATS